MYMMHVRRNLINSRHGGDHLAEISFRSLYPGAIYCIGGVDKCRLKVLGCYPGVQLCICLGGASPFLNFVSSRRTPLHSAELASFYITSDSRYIDVYYCSPRGPNIPAPSFDQVMFAAVFNYGKHLTYSYRLYVLYIRRFIYTTTTYQPVYAAGKTKLLLPFSCGLLFVR